MLRNPNCVAFVFIPRFDLWVILWFAGIFHLSKKPINLESSRAFFLYV